MWLQREDRLLQEIDYYKVMERYSVIDKKFPREFVLLQGIGCRWGRCTFCDYHSDIGDNPFEVNREVLERVTGLYGVLDVINSGSCIELDSESIEMIQNCRVFSGSISVVRYKRGGFQPYSL